MNARWIQGDVGGDEALQDLLQTADSMMKRNLADDYGYSWDEEGKQADSRLSRDIHRDRGSAAPGDTDASRRREEVRRGDSSQRRQFAETNTGKQTNTGKVRRGDSFYFRGVESHKLLWVSTDDLVLLCLQAAELERRIRRDSCRSSNRQAVAEMTIKLTEVDSMMRRSFTRQDLFVASAEAYRIRSLGCDFATAWRLRERDLSVYFAARYPGHVVDMNQLHSIRGLKASRQEEFRTDRKPQCFPYLGRPLKQDLPKK